MAEVVREEKMRKKMSSATVSPDTPLNDEELTENTPEARLQV